ncbi:DNA-binding transcriptional LysR family regulator [Methylopila capsulata]|uniref:DNA-binding transcriptional LysR family regulator n=1 Tax=Methylopila capsulata TaxID=61654 RepID=A0A9W6IWI4_9HYPH|nr:LysR family transcriptional regulator [Methylopila capsulata]MBM7852391.1 DNA-binding transcriptional LysR family regulator [Methylopila capsulata]GLK56600.1 LysR family transcriptional regulator [Methylopila capsulata]
MRTTDLSELAAFDAVARHRSFRRAGEERGVTASAVSHAVSNLEARMGIRLLNRTTRSVSLTDAGAMLLSRLSPAFDDIGAAVDGVNQFRDSPFGKVRINIPNSIAPFVIGPVIGPLLAANPNLELEIVATDRLVDIVDEGFDAGVRLGESLSDGMTAVKIRPRLRLVVVGAPVYLAERGTPRTPADLERHSCLQNLYPSGRRYAWSFEKDGKQIEFQPSGPLSSDDHEVLVEAAIGGLGLAYVWEDRAARAIRDGTLVPCLDGWRQPEDWLHLYYPTRKYMSAGLRALIQAMRV